MRLTTEVAWGRGAGTMEARLQTATADAVKIITLMGSKLKGSLVRVLHNFPMLYELHSLFFFVGAFLGFGSSRTYTPSVVP